MKNHIKIARVQKDLTQEQLGKLVHVSRQTIVALEKQKYVPSTLLALKLSLVLDKNAHQLFELEDEDWKSE